MTARLDTLLPASRALALGGLLLAVAVVNVVVRAVVGVVVVTSPAQG